MKVIGVVLTVIQMIAGLALGAMCLGFLLERREKAKKTLARLEQLEAYMRPYPEGHVFALFRWSSTPAEVKDCYRPDVEKGAFVPEWCVVTSEYESVFVRFLAGSTRDWYMSTHPKHHGRCVVFVMPAGVRAPEAGNLRETDSIPYDLLTPKERAARDKARGKDLPKGEAA